MLGECVSVLPVAAPVEGIKCRVRWGSWQPWQSLLSKYGPTSAFNIRRRFQNPNLIKFLSRVLLRPEEKNQPVALDDIFDVWQCVFVFLVDVFGKDA